MSKINIQTNIFQIPNFTINQKAADRPPDQLTKEKLLLYLINTKVIFSAICLLHIVCSCCIPAAYLVITRNKFNSRTKWSKKDWNWWNRTLMPRLRIRPSKWTLSLKKSKNLSLNILDLNPCIDISMETQGCHPVWIFK